LSTAIADLSSLTYPYLHVTRQMTAGADGLLDPQTPPGDTIAMVFPGGRISTCEARTQATEKEDKAVPRVIPGWHRDVYIVGSHKGRSAFVQQGRPNLRYQRWGSGKVETAYIGLNLHSWRGNSNGCLTAPDWFIKAAIAGVLEWAERSGDKMPRLFGAPVVSLYLDER